MRAQLAGFPIRQEALPRTVRLVTTARLRDAVLRALADTEDEMALLALLEGATSARLTAAAGRLPGLPPEDLVGRVPHAAFVNAAFAYARPRGLNRFHGPDRGAWYAALAVRTALAEAPEVLGQLVQADCCCCNTALLHCCTAVLHVIMILLQHSPDNSPCRSFAGWCEPDCHAVTLYCCCTNLNTHVMTLT